MKFYVKHTSISLFARLHPSKAKALCKELIKSEEHDNNSNVQRNNDDEYDSSSYWCLDDNEVQKNGVVQFLALQIVMEEDGHDHILYASYNGGNIKDEINQNEIELHGSLFKNKNLLGSTKTTTNTEAIVEVKALRKVKNATKIIIEPINDSDWELIDCFSNYLENGGLLHQVSIVFVNQILALELPNGDVVYAMVKPFSESSDSNHPCLRLVQDTEVTILTKSRTAPPYYKPSNPLRVLPVSLDIDHHTFKGFSNSSHLLDTPLPCTIQMNPQTIQTNINLLPDNDTYYDQSSLTVLIWRTSSSSTLINPIGESNATNHDNDDDDNELNSSPVVLVNLIPSLDVPPNHIVMHPLTRIQIGVTPLHNYVQIQLLSKTQSDTSCLLLDQHQHQHHLQLTLQPISLIHSKFISHPNTYPTDTDSYHLAFPYYCAPSSPSSPSNENKKNYSELFIRKLLDDYFNAHFTKNANNHDFFPLTTQTLLSLPIVSSNNNNSSNKETLFLLTMVQRNDQSNNIINNNKNQILLTKRSHKTPCDEPQRSCPQFITTFQLKQLLKYNSETTTHNYNNNSPFLEISYNNTIRHVPLPIYESYFYLQPQIIYPSLLNDYYYENKCIEFFHNNSSPPILLAYADEGMGKTHFALTISYLLRHNFQNREDDNGDNGGGGGIAMVYLNCRHLQSATIKMKSVLDQLTSTFLSACNVSPSILILDDLDILVPNLDDGNGNNDPDGNNKHQNIQYQGSNPIVINQVKLISDHIKMLIDELHDNNVYILGTCQNQHTLDKSLTSSSSHYFYHNIAIHQIPLLPIQRYQIFQQMIIYQHNNTDYKKNKEIEENLLKKIINQNNFISLFLKYSQSIKTLKDLMVLTKLVYDSLLKQQLLQCASIKNKDDEFPPTQVPKTNSYNTLRNVIKTYIKSSSSTISTESSDELQSSHSRWEDDIGGLFHAKQSLTEAIIHPITFKRVYDNSPVSLSKGILLFGPSGCGKSYLIPALAKKCNLSLITVHGPEILDKFIGSSESKIRSIFHQAKASSPCLLFFDNFDSLALQRGSDHTGVTDRIVNQLLTFLDGVETTNDVNDNNTNTIVYVIAATSRPNVIDNALIRPGRLDQHIYISYPCSLQEQKDIILKLSKDLIFEVDALQLIQSDLIFEEVKHCQYYTPADWKAVFDTSYLNAIRSTVLRTTSNASTGNLLSLSDKEVIERFTCSMKYQNNLITISKEHLMQAFKETKPSVSPKERVNLERYYNSFIGSSSGKSNAGIEERHKSYDKVDSKTALM